MKVFIEDMTAAHLKLDIFRAILISQGAVPAPGSAALVANNVYKTLYKDEQKPAAPKAKKRAR